MVFIFGTIFVDHIDMAKRAEILEATALDYFDNDKQLRKEEYHTIVTPCTSLFKNSLVKHFKVEETAIFPILIEKTQDARHTVRDFLSDHTMLMKMFSEYETTEDQNRSLRLLTDLMKDLSYHIGKEDEFFQSFMLSKNETTRIDELALKLGFGIP